MSEVRALVDKLNAMTTEDIRKLMQDEKIEGDKGNGTACVIAMFLFRHTGTTRTEVSNSVILAYGTGGPEFIRTSASLSHFIHNFDFGMYPELDSWLQARGRALAEELARQRAHGIVKLDVLSLSPSTVSAAATVA